MPVAPHRKYLPTTHALLIHPARRLGDVILTLPISGHRDEWTKDFWIYGQKKCPQGSGHIGGLILMQEDLVLRTRPLCKHYSHRTSEMIAFLWIV